MIIMKIIASIIGLATLFGSVHSWVLPKEAVQKAFAVAGFSAALVASPLPGTAFDPTEMSGYYSDPNHPNCKRVIEVAAPVASITGTDGNPGCPADGSGRTWTVSGKVKGKTLLADFSSKGGPADLKGEYDSSEPAGIKWPDGNKWVKKTDK